MKKVLWLIVCLMTIVLASCSSKTYIVTANYDVCYPDGTRNYEKSVKVESYDDANLGVISHSFSGTNYISVTTSDNPLLGKDVTKLQHIEETTAPMRLNNYSFEKYKKPKVRCIAVNKKGKKCNNIAEDGKQYCWKHE